LSIDQDRADVLWTSVLTPDLLGREAGRDRHPGVTDAAGNTGESALKASIMAA
jgi:hypothetical protein